MFNKDLIFRVKIKNINVGYTFADNRGRDIQGESFLASNIFSISSDSATFELSTFNYGGYLAWYPKGKDVENAYYGIAVKKDAVALTYFNAANMESNYSLNLATEQFVNNKITGAINSNY